ncbi:MAG: TetR/AcrR family transcriptional regulator [Sporichthyaceae bacterium]
MAKSDAPEVNLRTVDQRVAGTRARATRDRILETLAGLLSSKSYRNIRVTDVVTEVGTSPATFYQYFADVETAVLALAQDVAKESAGLKTLNKGASWTGKAGGASATALVDGIGAFVRANGAVIRVIESSAAEGDARYKKVRTTLRSNLGAPIAAASADGKKNAAALVGVISAAATAKGAEATEAKAAAYRLVHFAVTGRKAP